jgi:hypothetical protein
VTAGCEIPSFLEALEKLFSFTTVKNVSIFEKSLNTSYP